MNLSVYSIALTPRNVAPRMTISTLAVIDPERKTVVWAMQGGWRKQHQPSVVGGSTLLLFDNTGTMHRADWYSLDSERLMHRTTLEGEEPIS